MKKKSFKRTPGGGGGGGRRGGVRGKMKGPLARSSTPGHLQSQLTSLFLQPPKPSCPMFHEHQNSGAAPPEAHRPPLPPPNESENPETNLDFILSQDFFCTPDYITPDNQNLMNSVNCIMENSPCPKSPEKVKTGCKTSGRAFTGIDVVSLNPLSPSLSGSQQVEELGEDALGGNEAMTENIVVKETKKVHSYVPQSAVALRLRVMPPPCIKNPYLNQASDVETDPFGNRRSKYAGFFPATIGGDGLSRYHTDFHEIQQIGAGNFSRVFKVLKRIDGCLYAVKHSTRQLLKDTERGKALMEVQALAALGSHENITSYYSSWFENEQLYIQMELCDYSLSVRTLSQSFTENEALKVLYQIAKALQFMHDRGIAHLDVKPDNIYVKNGIYKLGDFGCATLLDKSLPVEEGDARYMPREILNDDYDHLDKVDIFSLGAAIYEIIRGSLLLDSRPQFINLRDGRLFLRGHSLQFQNLLKMMVDPDPRHRPSAKELVENPIFDRFRTNKTTLLNVNLCWQRRQTVLNILCCVMHQILYTSMVLGL